MEDIVIFHVFIFHGNQANVNFRTHADNLAREVGVPGSGRAVGIGGEHYEVTLDVNKVLATTQ